MDELKFERMNKAYNDRTVLLTQNEIPVYMKHDIFHAIDKIASNYDWSHKAKLEILDNLIMSLAYMYVDLKEGRMLVLRDEEIHRD